MSADPDYVESSDGEAVNDGTEPRGARCRQRRKRKCAAADRSALEWQCVTIVNESDDVNPVVQCKFCPWKSGAGATRIRQHILRKGPAAKCTGAGGEYEAMKSQLREKADSTPPRDPVETSVKRACVAALQKENEQLKEENARLRAQIATLEENARLRAQVESIQMLPVATAHEMA